MDERTDEGISSSSSKSWWWKLSNFLSPPTSPHHFEKGETTHTHMTSSSFHVTFNIYTELISALAALFKREKGKIKSFSNWNQIKHVSVWVSRKNKCWIWNELFRDHWLFSICAIHFLQEEEEDEPMMQVRKCAAGWLGLCVCLFALSLWCSTFFSLLLYLPTKWNRRFPPFQPRNRSTWLFFF